MKAAIAAGTAPYKAAWAKHQTLAAGYRSDKGAPTADYSVPGIYTDRTAWEAAVAGFTRDADACHCLALVYALDGDTTAAAIVATILRAWYNTSTTAEAHEVLQPDGKTYVENDAPLSMAELGAGFIMAALLIDSYSGWTGSDRVKFAVWVQNVYGPECDRAYISPTMSNNWADWGAFGGCMADYYLMGRVSVTHVALVQANIDAQIAVDGSLPQEDARGSGAAIWYRYFALTPMTAACRVIRNSGGPNLFTYVNKAGASIRTALDSLLAMVKNPPAGFSSPGATDPWPADLFTAMGAEYGDTAYSAYGATKAPITYVGHHEAWTFASLMSVPGK